MKVPVGNIPAFFKKITEGTIDGQHQGWWEDSSHENWAKFIKRELEKLTDSKWDILETVFSQDWVGKGGGRVATGALEEEIVEKIKTNAFAIYSIRYIPQDKSWSYPNFGITKHGFDHDHVWYATAHYPYDMYFENSLDVEEYLSDATEAGFEPATVSQYGWVGKGDGPILCHFKPSAIAEDWEVQGNLFVILTPHENYSTLNFSNEIIQILCR